MANVQLILSIGSINGTASNLTIRQGEKFTLKIKGDTRELDWFANADQVLEMVRPPNDNKQATFTAVNLGKSLVQVQERMPEPRPDQPVEERTRVALVLAYWVTVVPPEAVSATITSRGTEALDAEHAGTDPTA